MIELGQDLCFASEAREPIGIAREDLGKDFERDVSIQLGIVGAIHLAHAARTNELADFIDPEPIAG